MSRIGRVGYIVLFLAFSVIGLAIAAFGDGTDRLLGVGVLLFFGGGGLMWYLVTRPPSAASGGFRIGSHSAGGGTVPAFIVDYDATRVIAAGAGLLAMAVAAGSFALLNPDGDPVERLLPGGVGMLFGLLGGVTLVRARHGHVAFTRSGFVVTSATGAVTIEWDNIAAIGEMSVRGNPMLAIRLIDPSRLRTSTVHRLLHPFERSLTGADLSIPVRMLKLEPTQLHAAVARYLTDSEARARIGSAGELEALDGAPPPWPAAEKEDAAPAADAAPRPPLRARLASASLLVLGGMLGLIALVALFAGDGTPDERRSRMIGAAVIGVLAAGNLIAWGLLRRRRGLGRWIGLGASGATVLIALAINLGADDGPNPVGIAILVVALVCLAVVSWGTGAVRRAPS